MIQFFYNKKKQDIVAGKRWSDLKKIDDKNLSPEHAQRRIENLRVPQSNIRVYLPYFLRNYTLIFGCVFFDE